MKTTSPKQFCFVLMPFDSRFDDIYKHGIKTACTTKGVYCERLDEQTFEEQMLGRIYNQISKADLIIADMTNRNPNVFYEVGYAHALNKHVILLTQKIDDIPFDLKHFPHIEYSNSTTLKKALAKKLSFFLARKNKSTNSSNDHVAIRFGGKKIYAGDTVYVNLPYEIPTWPSRDWISVNFPVVSIQNISSKILNTDDMHISISSSVSFDVDGAGYVQTLAADELYQIKIPLTHNLFPEEYARLEIPTMAFTSMTMPKGISLDIYSEFGKASFSIIFKKHDAE